METIDKKVIIKETINNEKLMKKLNELEEILSYDQLCHELLDMEPVGNELGGSEDE